MPDASINAQAQIRAGGKPERERPADTPQDKTDGMVKPQDGPMDRSGTEAEEAADDPGEPMTNEPIPVTEDQPGVGLTEPDIEGTRGM